MREIPPSATVGKTVASVKTLADGRTRLGFDDGCTLTFAPIAAEPPNVPVATHAVPSEPNSSTSQPIPTPKQAEYLAFIDSYSQLHGRPPAERDFQIFFRTTPPSVHGMILTLERRGFISRIPGAARSIRLLIDRSLLPRLSRE